MTDDRQEQTEDAPLTALSLPTGAVNPLGVGGLYVVRMRWGVAALGLWSSLRSERLGDDLSVPDQESVGA